ncbi:MAG: MBL fold metallo-hydrolase [Chloroflexota bacterium]
MSKTFFRFQVGEFDCIALNDCRDLRMALPIRASLSNASEAELMEATRPYGFEPDEWVQDVYINCLFIDTGNRKILFDVGMGTPDVFSGSGKLRADLEDAGVSAHEIDTVILTHGHWDHVAGLVDDSHNLLFPNANYVMQQKEWDFWMNRTNLQKLNPKHQAFDAISFDKLPMISERIKLFETEGEILPGIIAIAAPGHTPGHTAFLISSGDDELLHIADLVHNDLHFEHPNWLHEVDIMSELSFESRRKVFFKAASNQMMVFGCHTTGPAFGLGQIETHGDAWKWRPWQ